MQIGYYKKSGAENLISLLQGVDVGAQRYVQGQRYNQEQAQQQQQYDRSYSLRLSEDARQNQAQKNQNDLMPDRIRSGKAEADYAEQRARAATNENNDQADFDAQQRRAQDYEAQIEIDSHRQEQAQEYKRVTGKDVPPEYWEKDAQGHKPGEMGWHWTQYDPRSPIPIKEQISYNRQAAEISTLPPGATREQRIKELNDKTKQRIVADSKQRVLDEASQYAMPEQQTGEPNPMQWVPPQTLKSLQESAKDPTVDADEMRKRWDAAVKSHNEETAFAESRMMALQGLDAFAQKHAQMQQDYGDQVGAISSEDFERFRIARHAIETSKLHGAPLDDAVRNAKELLKPGPKPPKAPQNDKTGFNAGDAFKFATAEAYDPRTPLGKAVAENPEKADILIQMRARAVMQQVHAISGGEMPGSPGGAPLSRPISQGAKVDPDQAARAGWTEEEFMEYERSGAMPKGKPVK